MVRVANCYGLGDIGWYDQPIKAEPDQVERARRIYDRGRLASHYDSATREYLLAEADDLVNCP